MYLQGTSVCREASISLAEGPKSLEQQSGPPCVVTGLQNLMKLSRMLSARISLFPHALPSQASVSPFARSYCGGRLSWCRGSR